MIDGHCPGRLSRGRPLNKVACGLYSLNTFFQEAKIESYTCLFGLDQSRVHNEYILKKTEATEFICSGPDFICCYPDFICY